MPDPTTPAAPAIDYEKLGAAIAGSLGAALAEQNKPLVEALAKLQTSATPPPAPAASGTAGKGGFTLDDVRNEMKTILGDFQKAQQVGSTVAEFVKEKMADIPAVYHKLLPNTADRAELAKAEQQIRQQYQADFKASGATPPNPVQGGQPGGQPPAAAVDIKNLSPTDKIALGLKQEGSPARTQIPPHAAVPGQAAQQ